ncbi:cache domain-containing protein, partial [Aliarcobacter butzleri]
NMQGGVNFAILVVYPNRPVLVGQVISPNYEDAVGKKFREEFLKDIRETGEFYTQYAYKKPDSNDSKHKLSYFKYYEIWNWI